MVSKVRRVPSIKVFAKPPEFPWLSQVKCRGRTCTMWSGQGGRLSGQVKCLHKQQTIKGSLSNVLLRFDFA